MKDMKIVVNMSEICDCPACERERKRTAPPKVEAKVEAPKCNPANPYNVSAFPNCFCEACESLRKMR